MSESTTFRRIHPAEVPGKFQRLGVHPVRGYFARTAESEYVAESIGVKRDKSFCVACALGIEAVDADRMVFGMAMQDFEPMAFVARLETDYAVGLSDGWEGFRVHQNETGPYFAGYEDGKAAYQACVDAGMHIYKG